MHIAAFMTLCEAYMGIEPHFDLWNYFLRTWLRQGSDAEAVVWGSVDIFLRSRAGSRSILLLFDVQPSGRVVKSMVLFEK
jgi:hypothetical protein